MVAQCGVQSILSTTVYHLHLILFVFPLFLSLYRLFLHRIADMPYLNLDGPDLQPSRDHIFHVRFPSEWKSVDLYDLFTPFGNIMISWIDDTSAMVGLMKKDRASQVKSSIEKSSLYQVTPYSDYKKSQYMAGDFIPFPAFQETPSAEAKTPKSPRGKKRVLDESPDQSGDFDPEVASFMSSTAKKHKQMDPNAAPFVSRRSVTPPTSSSGGLKLDRANSEDNEAAAKEPAKLFEESASW
nr:poly(A)-specific ribonuclease PARN-like [Lytechinus pictus]